MYFIKITKWNFDLDINLQNHEWNEIYKTCFKSISDNYLIWFQYKILNRILGTQYLMCKMRIVNDPSCRLCNDNVETLKHLFCECQYVHTLWENIQLWIKTKTGIEITLNNSNIILGYINQDETNKPLNMVLLRTKSYIFWCARQRKIPNIIDLQRNIKKTYDEQISLFTINQKIEKFNKIWVVWKNLFENI